MKKHFDVVELVYRKIITKKNKKEQQKQYTTTRKKEISNQGSQRLILKI